MKVVKSFRRICKNVGKYMKKKVSKIQKKHGKTFKNFQ